MENGIHILNVIITGMKKTVTRIEHALQRAFRLYFHYFPWGIVSENHNNWKNEMDWGQYRFRLFTVLFKAKLLAPQHQKIWNGEKRKISRKKNLNPYSCRKKHCSDNHVPFLRIGCRPQSHLLCMTHATWKNSDTIKCDTVNITFNWKMKMHNVSPLWTSTSWLVLPFLTFHKTLLIGGCIDIVSVTWLQVLNILDYPKYWGSLLYTHINFKMKSYS